MKHYTWEMVDDALNTVPTLELEGKSIIVWGASGGGNPSCHSFEKN